MRLLFFELHFVMSLFFGKVVASGGRKIFGCIHLRAFYKIFDHK